METLLTLVLQVVLAVVVAKLTLAGSRSQKWWERKAELYASLIEKLYDIHNFYSQWLNEDFLNRARLSVEEKAHRKCEEEVLNKRGKDGNDELEKLTHIGTFLISDAVHKDLLAYKDSKLKAWAENEGDIYDTAYSIIEAAKTCIESVCEHSKDDLGLNSRFGRFIQKVRSFSFE